MGKKDIRTVADFDKLINSNKELKRHWYHGLKGKWWHGMSSDDARKRIEMLEGGEKALSGKIVLVSTWNVRCGIATYTKYLFDNLSMIARDLFIVDPIISPGELRYRSTGKLTHLQHEFGIMPKSSKLEIENKLIVTWHTVSKNTNDEIERYESKYDVAGHIVHSEKMRRCIKSSTNVWVIPHGSVSIPQMKKEDARKILGLDIYNPGNPRNLFQNHNMPIGFVFGFQSGDKNYDRLIDAARNTGIHIIISGAQHRTGYSLDIKDDKNVTFINRYLDENEVNLYALASDILLFDYDGKSHYSVSGALHRIVGAGRPIICSDIRHFNDVENKVDCLKFKNQSELEKCITKALKEEARNRLSLAARNYSDRTGWNKVARSHMEVYKECLS